MSISTGIRRTALAAGTAAALAAVLTPTFSAPAASTDAMPRVRLVAPETPVGSLSASTSSSRPQGDRENHLQLAPYQTPIGAVISSHSTMEAFLTAAVIDVDKTWSRLFKGWGFKEPTVTYSFPAPGVVTESCGQATNDRAFQYCSSDDTITVNQAVAVDFWEGRNGARTVGGTGDMSIALFVAHEYGHNLEYELGYGDASVIQKENAADCFAGVWAKDAADRGILEQGDLNEALQGLFLVADAHEGGDHGTAEVRQHAFKVGYDQGTATCVTRFLR